MESKRFFFVAQMSCIPGGNFAGKKMHKFSGQKSCFFFCWPAKLQVVRSIGQTAGATAAFQKLG